ncbi:glycosyltransferase family 25 protein [Ectopseudomonas khazarica]|uniref:glycosyltransferase family 25 protein n=1 Tax=Ectopseudomonas khazarica TaxID=2502979 RepID=UPI003A9508AA
MINLDSRTDRWAAMQAQFERMGVNGNIQRFSAVRPPADIVEQPQLAGLRDFLKRVDGDSERLAAKLRSTWGCTQSHLGIIRLAQASGWPHVLILEDDCEFEPYSLPVLRRVARQMQSHDWDMLYLGGTYKKGGRLRRFSANLLDAGRIRLGHAYLVHERLYQRILDEAEGSGLPIDWYYSEILHPEVRSFLVTPVLAYQRLLDMSDIEAVERKPEFKTRKALRRLWSRIRYAAF